MYTNFRAKLALFVIVFRNRMLKGLTHFNFLILIFINTIYFHKVQKFNIPYKILSMFPANYYLSLLRFIYYEPALKEANNVKWPLPCSRDFFLAFRIFIDNVLAEVRNKHMYSLAYFQSVMLNVRKPVGVIYRS